jgi:hypothetical protein
MRNDYAGLQPDKLFRQHPNSTGVVGRIAIVQSDVLALHPAKRLKTLPERGNTSWQFRIGFGDPQ